MVDPHQLLGLEINPRAVAIADLVLWIGYLQWHFRTQGNQPLTTPILKNFNNIREQDAVLAYDGTEPVLDEKGRPVTRWDGRTMKVHPVTGEEVPDEAARVPVLHYINPRKAEWPEADYVVGNPPFIGTALMRDALGDGYTEAVRRIHDDVPESCDYVTYWWNHAAKLARAGAIKRFGFIATNSLRQTFNRRVLESQMTADDPVSLVFAIPDHPWVDSADGAAVRISMTVAQSGRWDGDLRKVVSEQNGDGEGTEVSLVSKVGRINSDLSIGTNVASSFSLAANGGLSCRGMQLIGSGFLVTPDEAKALGLGRVPGLERHIRLYRNGKDITRIPRDVMVIDLFGLSIDDVRKRFPEVYQWVYERVKPERDQNNRNSYRENWWILGEPRGNFRPALEGLSRYIATVETSKHRFFVFLDQSILPDNKLVGIALDDGYYLGVLSSRIHVTWALPEAAGSTLEDRPVYVKTTCFEKFPFPICSAKHKARIRELGEALDAHRKSQQSRHPRLKFTDMYNVLEKLRTGESLTKKELEVHKWGLVTVLKQIHDDLDVAVCEAYGWPKDLPDEEILARLVALNAERAVEERNGLIRWLRPDFQNRDGAAPKQEVLADTTEPALELPSPSLVKVGVRDSGEKGLWPKTLTEQVQAVRGFLSSSLGPSSPAQVTKSFKGAKAARVNEILETLAALGQVRRLENGEFVAA